jgi:hypothetical protein
MAADGVPDANRAASEALVYMANAWTRAGAGLFSSSLKENFHLALQLAVMLAVVPRLEGRPAVPREVLAGIAAILGDRASATRTLAGEQGPLHVLDNPSVRRSCAMVTTVRERR